MVKGGSKKEEGITFDRVKGGPLEKQEEKK